MSDTPRTDALIYRKNTIEMQRHELLDLALALERELAEAKKDAERYRWLRDNSYNVQIGVYELVNRDGRQQRAWLAGNELDDVIDAAIRKGE